jgi:two-component system, OmpR family, alkaline phosphatase synthesis response regulator PhoP
MSTSLELPAKILVVDDDESISTIYNHVLSREGYEVHTALDGIEAVAKTSAILPDLIILDLIMPEQEGIETLLQLHSKHPNIPVVTISGAVGASEYLHVSSLLGASVTLQKPIRPDTLVQTVQNVLRGVVKTE